MAGAPTGVRLRPQQIWLHPLQQRLPLSAAPFSEGGGGGGVELPGKMSTQGQEGDPLRAREMSRAGTRAALASAAGVNAAQRRLKVRNAFTALSIGAVVLGIYGYTFYSVSQERFLDELELEAKVMQGQAAKNPAE